MKSPPREHQDGLIAPAKVAASALSFERPGRWPQNWPAAVAAPGDCFAIAIAEATHGNDLVDGLLVRARHRRRPDIAVRVAVSRLGQRRAFERLHCGRHSRRDEHQERKIELGTVTSMAAAAFMPPLPRIVQQVPVLVLKVHKEQ